MPTIVRFLPAALALALAVLPLELAVAQTPDAQDKRPPITISIDELVADDAADAEVARNITEVVAGDLRRSGSFALIEWWRGDVRPQAVVTGRVDRQGDGRLKVEVRLWDVAADRHLAGQQYLAEPGNWRRVAHAISDWIHERITGKPGGFDIDRRN